MEVKQVARIPSSRAGGGAVPVAVSVGQDHLTFACPDVGHYNAISLCQHHLPTTAQVLVRAAAHTEPVQALQFSPGPQSLLLCSATSSNTLLWDVDALLGGGEVYSPRECHGAMEGAAKDIAFSGDGLHVAVSRGNTVVVYSTETSLVDTTLLGHEGVVSCILFISLFPLALLTLSEDRSFKVWNLEDSSLTYQSHIISSSPFLCGAVDVQCQHFATGTEDGMVRVFDLRAGAGFKCLMKCDVQKALSRRQRMELEDGSCDSPRSCDSRNIGGVAIHSGRPRTIEPDLPPGPAVEAGVAVVGMCYLPRQSECPAESDREQKALVVVMLMDILWFNGQTLDLLDSMSLSGLPPVPAMATCAFAHADTQGFIVSGSLFSDEVTVLSVSLWSAKTTTLSVLSRQPLQENSPLRSVFNWKPKPASTKASRSGRPIGQRGTAGQQAKSGPGRPGAVKDQPLTFKSKIKSSGYTSEPRRDMFNPKPRSNGGLAKKGGGGGAGGGGRDMSKSYPVHCSPTCHPLHSQQLMDQPHPIHTSAFNGSGSVLVCGSADRSLYSIKMPPTSDKITAFVGHDGPVLATSWSHSDEWLLTSSADRTTCVWSGGAKDTPLLRLDRMQHSYKDSDPKDSNPLFKKEVPFAQFYYMDKFILLSCGNSLLLYKYHIDTHTPDDIKRYQSNSRYKLVTAVQMQTAPQTITAVSAINDFHSYLVLLGGSNKALEVYDMNVEKCVLTLPEAHTRAVHCICQSKGTKYVTPQASGHYDLFATSALTDGIKLWDLRTTGCVHRYSSHANQSHPSVMATISPCAKYIATGSEDRSAYIYDLRTSSSPLNKLSGHSSTVTALAYHPLKPTLATATSDGQIMFFTEKNIK